MLRYSCGTQARTSGVLAVLALAALIAAQAAAATAEAAPTNKQPTYLETTLQATIDAAHAKPGSAISLKALYDWSGQGCLLHRNSNLQGHVVSVRKAVGRSGDSELSLAIDSADCVGHRQNPMSLMIVQIVAEDSTPEEHLHSALPQQLSGGSRSAGGTSGDIVEDYKTKGKSTGPFVIHPGVICCVKDVSLHMDAGPEKSALVTRTQGNVKISADSEIVLFERPAHVSSHPAETSPE